jgi:glucan phosphorylase
MNDTGTSGDKTDKKFAARFLERIGFHKRPKTVVEHITTEKLAIKNRTKLTKESKPSPKDRAYKAKRDRINKIAAHSRMMNRIRFA